MLIKFMKKYFSRLFLSYPLIVVYMLQSTEYSVADFFDWHRKTSNFKKVLKRGKLHKTKPFVLLASYMYFVIFILLVVSFLLIGFDKNLITKIVGGILLVLTPVISVYLLVVPLQIARIVIVNPRNKLKLKNAQEIFESQKALKIAIAGSYGKTSMKELLLTVLGEHKKVVASKGNLNVMTSHARFAQSLKGDEDVIIVEFGEGAPGDIEKFSSLFVPDLAVITGIAPAHMDSYGSLENIARDLFTLREIVKKGKLFVNGESAYVKDFIEQGTIVYSEKGISDLKVSDIKVDIHGTSFTLKHNNRNIEIKSRLIGRHHVGPLCLAVFMGYSMGMETKQIVEAIAKTIPYEHRMQPYPLNGATVIDDTYNGTIEGMAAGLALLSELQAQRKVYVTPGLVEQGAEFINIHKKLGSLIVQSNPDVVVLMQNDGTKIIADTLHKGKFKGDIIINDEPLNFYNTLNLFVASGDVVLMQNDLTDNYSRY